MSGDATGSTDTIAVGFEGYTASIPSNPRRVVTIESRAGLDFALAAGLPIVGASIDPQSPLATRLPDDVARIGDLDTELAPNWEAIYAAEPDLLVVNDGFWRFYRDEGLLRSDNDVPTLIVPTGDPMSTWKPALIAQLERLDWTDRAGTALDGYERALLSARERIGDRLAGKSVAIGGGAGDQWWLSHQTFATSVAEELGLTLVTDPTAPTDGTLQFYGAETLGDVFGNADVLVIQNLDTGIADTPTFASLPAAQAGNAFALPHFYVAGGILTATDLVDFLADIAEQVH